jgi:class 3 adenylate cyclase
MSPRIVGDFAEPDRVQQGGGGVRLTTLQFGDISVTRIENPVGWRWSTHVKPIVGTESCQAHHVGFQISGRLGVLLDDGTTWEVLPGQVFDFPPGHDGYVIGDEPVVAIEWVGLANWLEPREQSRALAALLFTDIVDSTTMAAAVGDRAWLSRLSAHDAVVRRALENHGGHEVNTTGDGFFAYFEGPAQALRAARTIREGTAEIGLSVRQGIHVGEVHILDGKVEGLAVHEAARVASAAGAGEVLVSEVTRALAMAAGYTFEPRGEQLLKGLDGPRTLFALTG